MPYAGQTWTDGVTPLDATHMNALDAGVVGAVDVDNVAAAASVIVQNKLLAGDAQPAFRVLGDGSHGWGPGGSTAPDTNLYRASAGVLKTDGAMIVVGILNNRAFIQNNTQAQYSYVFVSNVSGDTANRFTIQNGGEIGWGPGGTTNPDLLLYRGGAAQLNLNGVFSPSAGVSTTTYTSFNSSGVIGAFQTALGGDSSYRFTINSNGAMNWGSGAASSDTDLYRAAAGQLKTDGSFVSGGIVWSSVAGQTVGVGEVYAGIAGLKLGSAGDTNLYRSAAGYLRTDTFFAVGYSIFVDQNDANQKLFFGSALDTNLYRSASATLKTDSSFQAANVVTALGLAGQIYLAADGKINFGTALDTNLYRAAASVLQTGGDFRADSSLTAKYGSSLQVRLGYTLPSGLAGVTFGFPEDTYLYRSAAGTLTAAGGLVVAGDAGVGFLSQLTLFISGVGNRQVRMHGAADSGGSGYRMLVVPN